MLKQLPPNKVNEIKKYWSILSIYEEFNKKFEVELYKALERSYIDFSLVALSIYEQTNRKQYIYGMNHCPNAEVRNLFHGSQIDPISNIITNGFLYTRKAFYGMGIYFTDMLDYASFYAGGKDYKTRRMNFKKILPVNETFSCVSAEVYYSKNKKIDIYDFSLRVPDLDHFPSYEEIKSNWENKMVEKNGLHFARVEPNQGQVRKREDIIKDTKKGAFLGTEYVITEMDQILPLYGLTFKRNEFIVVWRDNHFKGQNKFSDYLKERKLFIYEYAKMNAYFTGSTEEALEIIKEDIPENTIRIEFGTTDYAKNKKVILTAELEGTNFKEEWEQKAIKDWSHIIEWQLNNEDYKNLSTKVLHFQVNERLRGNKNKFKGEGKIKLDKLENENEFSEFFEFTLKTKRMVPHVNIAFKIRKCIKPKTEKFTKRIFCFTKFYPPFKE